MTGEPRWLGVEVTLLFHEHLIRDHGGAAGVRDQGLLESALDRPRNIFAYGSQDLFVLASAYAHDIAKNHSFVDGNKRVAFALTRVFLGVNGIAFDPPEAEAVVMVEGLASGELDQAGFAKWLRKHSKAAKRRRS